MQTASYQTANERGRTGSTASATRGAAYAGSPPAARHRAVYYAVYGIRTDDAETAALVTQVMHIATWMSILALASAILSLFSGWYFTLGLIPAVFIPCCGWSGAANRSRTALWFFIFFNALFAAIFIGSFTVSIIQTKGQFGSGAGALFWVSLGVGLAMAVLQVLGVVYGTRLVRSKHFKGHYDVHASSVPVAVPVDVEAGQTYPPQGPGPNRQYETWQSGPAYGYGGAPGTAYPPPAQAYAGAYMPTGSPQAAPGHPAYTYAAPQLGAQPPQHWQYSTYQPPAGPSFGGARTSGHTPMASPPLAPDFGTPTPVPGLGGSGATAGKSLDSDRPTGSPPAGHGRRSSQPATGTTITGTPRAGSAGPSVGGPGSGATASTPATGNPPAASERGRGPGRLSDPGYSGRMPVRSTSSTG